MKGKKTLRKRSKKNKLLLVVTIIVLVLGIFGFSQLQNILGIANTFDNTELTTTSDDKKTKGILLLGVDNNGGLEGGYTDSITYLGTKDQVSEIYALPIYRDARILNTCTNSEININNIYKKNGIKCLADSTSQFLNLPIDKYAIITMEGVYKIVEKLGDLKITPKETFCSPSGTTGITHCFNSGVEETMSPDKTIAYMRHRGKSNGENRSDRQVQIISAMKNRCTSEILDCYNNVAPIISSAFKTNIGILEIRDFGILFGSNKQTKNLGVIKGRNAETPNGWTQYVNENDKNEKTKIIREKIFS